MNNFIVKLVFPFAFLVTSHLATNDLGKWKQEGLSRAYSSFWDKGAEQNAGLQVLLENTSIFGISFQESVKWDLNIEGFGFARGRWSNNLEFILQKEVIIVEGICNLDEIKVEEVELMVMPLKVGGGDGAPARVIARPLHKI